MRREMIVIATDKQTFVYNFDDLQLKEVHHTCLNPRGLVALNPEGENLMVATLQKEHGHIRLTAYNKKKSHIIRAHENMIAAVALDRSGELIATASEKGTLIRLTHALNGMVL